MANRSLKVISEDWKCCATKQRPNQLKKTNSGDESAEGNERCTFDVVQNRDNVLSEQLRGAATELGSLNQLENGSNLWIFVGEQITGQGRTKREDHVYSCQINSVERNLSRFVV